MLTELEQRADTEARHAHRELLEEADARVAAAMSEDLVERLRDLADHASYEPHMHHIAADEITRLRTALRDLRDKLIEDVEKAASHPLPTCTPWCLHNRGTSNG